jgi:exodeoxyribonuclease V alpha subunit
MQESHHVNQLKFVIGTVTQIIYENYKNPLSPFCICDVVIQDTNIEVNKEVIRVILQSTPPEKENLAYKFFGTVEISPKYGTSFKCDTYIRNIPISSAHVIDFLGSGLFNGIKRKRAAQIVNTLGEDCLIQIITSPEVLRKVKGIPKKTIKSIQETIIENLGMQTIITKLHEWNISLNLAKNIYKLFGDASVQKIMENPYCLANTIPGFGFKKADEVADKIEIRGSDSRRIKGAIEYALHKIYDDDGSTFANKGSIIQKVNKILYEQDGFYYPSVVIDDNLTELISTDVNDLEDFTTEIGQIRQINMRIYLEKYYRYEQNIAEKLSLLHSKKEVLSDKDYERLVNYYISMISQLGFELSSEQEDAILMSILNNVLVITGGPGTGKSTIIKSIVMLYRKFFEINHSNLLVRKVFLLAPTGRAAKRMKEITGIPTQTIDRYLYIQQTDSAEQEDRLFIIDEMSMMDITNMSKFLEKLHKGDRIILVGDKEQLPPVKAGNVFEDIIGSDVFPTIELKNVFRQEQHSTINDLAASIRRREISEKHIENSDDVKWQPTAKEDIVKAIESEVFSILNQDIPFEDIQIIAPIHSGEQGIKSINQYIQNLLITRKIPTTESFTSTGFHNSDYEFTIGDRVIQLKNNSEKNVLNGDLGVVVCVQSSFELMQFNEDTEEEEIVEEPERLLVRFDNQEVSYYKEDMDELALAYCFSVHKSQGSEFPNVLLPISSAYTMMMNRNLLYTAITRAKKGLTIIGELDVFLIGLEKNPRQRFTFLRDMLAQSM